MVPIDFEDAKPGMFAFWTYDKYPYVIGAEITDISTDEDGEYAHGRIQAVGFTGYWFKPFVILDDVDGPKHVEEIKALRVIEATLTRDLEIHLDIERIIHLGSEFVNMLKEAKQPKVSG